jgi:hypothetical protein
LLQRSDFVFPTTGANLALKDAWSAPELRAANNIITGKRHGIA